MSNGTNSVNETGFVEFTASLISEVFRGVIATHGEQERNIAELQRGVSLTPREFAEEFLSAAQVRAEIVRLFHPTANQSPVDPGMPYIPGTSSEETPAIFKLTGYKMLEGDWRKTDRGLVISKPGAANIAGQVKENLALQQQTLLRAILARGMPRVYVDHGRVFAKLTIRLEDATTSSASTAPANKKSLLGAALNRRLLVAPVNARGPEVLTLRTDITSEIEIAFKTIVD